jgi:hypothetical protein
MKKNFTKDKCIQLLKRDLKIVPSNDGQDISKYATPENLIITITTKTKIRKNYTFGGPYYCAIINFSDPEELRIDFLSPRKKAYTIVWAKVNEITLHYIHLN